MKTFNIPLFKAETNFQVRALYELDRQMTEYFAENKMIPGQPLGKDLGIFVTVMTKEEIERLQKMPVAEAQKELQTSVPRKP